jgi:hypothetical protein
MIREALDGQDVQHRFSFAEYAAGEGEGDDRKPKTFLCPYDPERAAAIFAARSGS